MPLTSEDRRILKEYSDNGKRFEYWTYLIERTGDPYARLALSVVTNETYAGYIANEFAAQRAADLGQTLSPEQWWEVGVGIMQADFAARTSDNKEVTPDGGFTVNVKAIATYHAKVFSDSRLDKWAWTAQLPLNDALERGDLAQANAIWQTMLDNTTWAGLANDLGSLKAVLLANPAATPLQASAWLARTTTAALGYAVSPHTSYRDPNRINGYQFDAKTGLWYPEPNPLTGTVSTTPVDAATGQKLQSLREFRLQKFGTHVLKVSALEIDTQNPLESVGHELITRANAWAQVAGNDELADAQALQYNADLSARVQAALDQLDLTDASLYQDELGTWISSKNGSQVAVSRTGLVSAYSSQHHADGSMTWQRLNPDGTRTLGYRYTDPATGGTGVLLIGQDTQGRETERQLLGFDTAGHLESVEQTGGGNTQRLAFDPTAELGPAPETGTGTLQNAINDYGGALLDALSLVRAIQTGQPLPVMASGLRLINDISQINKTPNLTLSGAAYAASGVLSVLALNEALKRGDGIAALAAGAQAVVAGASAYANFAGQAGLSEAIKAGTFGDAGQALGAISEALPYLNAINALAHGDEIGMAVALISIQFPGIGWAYAAYSILDGLLGGGDVPDPWGSGQYVWQGNGVGLQTAGESGGQEAVENAMDSTLAVLNALIERQRQLNPGSSLGVIPNRMPSVGYDMSGYRYTDIDPLTGAERHPNLRFDTSGRPYNAEPGSPESFQSMVESMVFSALSRQAIAPMWEVQTARLQTLRGDPKAGLTEEARAGRDGQLAAPVTGDQQVFRPVALDLDGDGIETTDRAHGVAFDVDDSGYLKRTAWVKGDDALLVLDRNLNGQYDSGKELFSNSAVALSRRGLGALAWVDADGDGRLTAADPVWNELKAWRDLNQNGAQDAGELQTLDALGMSELNYALATFTRNGVRHQLGSPDLSADRNGSRLSVVPEGIVVQASEDGHLSLIVTRVDDKTVLEANRDGITGYEDVELIVSAASLLANDSLGGMTGPNLRITGLTNLRHGTGYVDDNGFVHFKPEANYSGTGAGFDYVVRAQSGQEATAKVDVTLQGTNDAPTLGGVQTATRPVYGYQPAIVYATDDSGGREYIGDSPIYAPFATLTWGDSESGYSIEYILDAQPGDPRLVYHNTPIAAESTGAGRVMGTDAEDAPSALTYELVNGPQYGAVTLNRDGTFQYTSWMAPDTPSSRLMRNGEYVAYYNGGVYGSGNLGSGVYPGVDVFQVRITDSQGASSVQSITVPHLGPYIPNLPTGGGKPVAVDLDGDGFEFVNVDDSQVFFDVTGDGWRRRTAWVGRDDGLLAFDGNGDGRIDQASELAFARYQAGAQTDLQGLKAFDTNGDGRLSAADVQWTSFGIWQDTNQNGETDAGEFRSLGAMGISAVRLDSDGRFQVINGQTVHGVGAIDKTDGSQLAVADVTLAYRDEARLRAADGNWVPVNLSPPRSADSSVQGTDDADLLLGEKSNTLIQAKAGDDVVFEDTGNDVIDGGDGNDMVYAGADNDLLLGGAGDDTLYAGLGDDTALGGDGHDAILMEGGNDIALGGAGNDFISGGWGNDVLAGEAGDDQLFGEAGRDALFGGTGDDELWGLDDNDLLDGGAGDDGLDGGAGADAMAGGEGNDTYTVDNLADTITELDGQGTDTVQTTLDGYVLGNTLENLRLLGTAALTAHGNAGNNSLRGNGGRNTLFGEAGDDRLDGGLGADTLVGGQGDDTYWVDDAGDTVIEAADEGVDLVKASVSYVLPDEVENLVLMGATHLNGTGNAKDNRLIGNSGDNRLDGGAGADTMVGGLGNDTYWVDSLNDVVLELADQGEDLVVSSVDLELGDHLEDLRLAGAARIGTGNALNNTITGNDSDNVLDGGAGADSMAGGLGNDTYWIDDAGDTVTEQIDAGHDTVISRVDHTLGANVEDLVLAGSALRGTGNALNNQFTGNSNDNLLDGGTGADTMAGGQGNDTYWIDDAGDTVTELADAGHDTVISLVDHTLTENVEDLMLTGSALRGTGNALDNLLTGNSADNGLDGGTGADSMAGGMGNDTYWVENLADAVMENEAEGTDLVIANLSYVLPAHVEALRLTGHANLSGQGNKLNNTITGNDGDNLLDGGAGQDLMAGALGDDRYCVDDAEDLVVEAFNAGADTVVASVSYSLSDNVEHLVLTGSRNLAGIGNGLDNTLVGNDGNNRLDGDLGADLMRGGRGDDEYWIDDAGDSVTEAAEEGIDTVNASVSWTLSAHVENLALVGDGDLSGTGNALNNQLAGNGGDNVLDGGAGADSMAGGQGNDTYWIDDAGDSVTEQIDAGHDTVISRVDHTLTANVEDLVLAGSALRGTGNALNNRLTGNSSDNLLDGGTGADSMAGGQGNDTYWIDDAGDSVTEQADGGHDTAISRVDHTLATNVEDLVLVGPVQRGIGNALDNQLTGNNADNLLDGGAGADHMAGGLGDDTYVVDNAGDRVIEWASEGADTVIASVSYVLPEHVENLTLIAGDSLIGTGNSADNRMIGGTGDDTLRGEAGDDWMEGGAGNDVLIGGTGDDTLFGGQGQDRYGYGWGDGLDRIVEEGGEDELAFGAGLTLDNVALRIVWSGNTGTARVRVLDACGSEQSDQGIDFDVSRLGDGSMVSAIERFRFADGSAVGLSELLVHSTLMAVPSGTRLVVTGRDDDTIFAGSGATTIRSGTGNDTVFGGSGNDSIQGEGGNDALYGGSGNDWLDGGCCTDLLMGGDGRDQLVAMEGQGALFGGRQDDVLHSGQGSHFLAGGKGDDAIWIGAGQQVLAFNKGDGRDVVWGESGASSTLSFGQDLTLNELDLRRTGSDLIVDAGAGVQVTLKNWYGAGGSQHVERLQFVSRDEPDRCREEPAWQVNTYDFKSLVQAFDTASLSNPKLNRWEAANERLSAHLSTSDTLALGGALAAQYAVGSENAIDPALAFTSLDGIDFGRQAQRLSPAGTPRATSSLTIA